MTVAVTPPTTEDEFVALLAKYGMTESATGRVHTVFMSAEAYRRMMVAPRDRRTTAYRQAAERASRLRAEGGGVLNYMGVRLVTAGGGATGCELHLHPEHAGVV